jgi:hypothetical protein
LTCFHSWSHLWAVEAQWAGWWSVPVQSLLGKPAGLQCFFVDWAGSDAKSWMGHRDWASYDDCLVLCNNQKPSHLTAWPPWDDSMDVEMLQFFQPCAEPAQLMENLASWWSHSNSRESLVSQNLAEESR